MFVRKDSRQTCGIAAGSTPRSRPPSPFFDISHIILRRSASTAGSEYNHRSKQKPANTAKFQSGSGMNNLTASLLWQRYFHQLNRVQIRFASLCGSMSIFHWTLLRWVPPNSAAKSPSPVLLYLLYPFDRGLWNRLRTAKSGHRHSTVQLVLNELHPSSQFSYRRQPPTTI